MLATARIAVEHGMFNSIRQVAFIGTLSNTLGPHVSVSPRESAFQMASRSVQPFLPNTQAHAQNHATPRRAWDSPHLARLTVLAMRAKCHVHDKQQPPTGRRCKPEIRRRRVRVTSSDNEIVLPVFDLSHAAHATLYFRPGLPT